MERFVHYLHPLLQSHPGSVAPSITLPQLRVIAQTNFHQLIALSLSVHFNPRRPYAGHTGKEEKLIICKNGWNALRNYISSEREKVWRAEMTGLSVREQRMYKKRRKEEKKVANAAIREGRMAKFIDIANEYSINYAAFVKLGDEHSGRLRFRQIKKEQKDAAANALVNSSALISASNVNAAISSVLPSPRMAPSSYTLAHVVDEGAAKPPTDATQLPAMELEDSLQGGAGLMIAGEAQPSSSASTSSSSSSSSSSPPPSTWLGEWQGVDGKVEMKTDGQVDAPGMKVPISDGDGLKRRWVEFSESRELDGSTGYKRQRVEGQVGGVDVSGGPMTDMRWPGSSSRLGGGHGLAAMNGSGSSSIAPPPVIPHPIIPPPVIPPAGSLI